jgi:hypothetical protein
VSRLTTEQILLLVILIGIPLVRAFWQRLQESVKAARQPPKEVAPGAAEVSRPLDSPGTTPAGAATPRPPRPGRPPATPIPAPTPTAIRTGKVKALRARNASSPAALAADPRSARPRAARGLQRIGIGSARQAWLAKMVLDPPPGLDS